MFRAIWRAVDHRDRWERVIYKFLLVASVLLIFPGIPASVMIAEYVPYTDTFMMSENDPDWDSNPARGFASRVQQNEVADRENKQIFYTALLTPIGTIVGLWGLFTAILAMADRARTGRPK